MTLRRHVLPLSVTRGTLSAAVLGALACMAPPSFAQATATPVIVTKPAEPPKKAEEKAPPPPETGVDATVTVTASRPTNRIDRQSYDVSTDVSASNASAADVLNNVPSVAVDPDGTVTLRGSPNLQIFIDGKPSAMLQGDNRGPTLNSLSADDIESIEVIHNPGAQFGTEAGGGPILNIVMRRTRKPGGFGSVSANGGSAGRYNSAFSGSYNTGRFGIQGGVNVRHDGRNTVGRLDRVRIAALTGIGARSSQDAVSTGLNDAAGINTSVTYNLGSKDTLGASAAFSKRSNGQHAEDHYVSFGADDIADSDYTRTTQRRGSSENHSMGARMDHKGDTSGEVLKLDLRASSAANASDAAYLNAYLVRPAGRLDARSRQDNDSDTRILDFTGDYELPTEGGAFLKLGYKAARHQNSFGTLYTTVDPLTLAETPNAVRSNRFELDQATYALYGSYQVRLAERWNLMGGLRTEFTRMQIAQITAATTAGNRYVNHIPSVFVTYKAADDTNIRFSYAHRIRRPGANDLNPFVVYRDDFNVSSGNPNLRPTQADSIELGYETRFGTLDTTLRSYFRRDSGLISERKLFISDTVLLTTRDNVGSNRAGGLEFTMGGKIMPGLSVNTSGNLALTEQRAVNALTLAESTRNARSLSARARLNYQVSAADQLQVSLNAQGRTLSGQGYRQPNKTANVSFRHALSPALSVVMNVTDVFNTNRIATQTDTELLHDTNIRRADGRIVYIGLSYRLGGVAAPAGRAVPRAPAGGARDVPRGG